MADKEDGPIKDVKKIPGYLYWGDDDVSRDAAFLKAGENIDSYDGIRSATASHRSFLNIEPNISVRPSYTRDDYYGFRPSEEPASKVKKSIKQCMDAYDKVGIIKNVIDLMGDFASQGITINHKNPKVQKFLRKWWEKVGGSERSERFLNILYRTGNVVVYRRTAKMKRKIREEMSKGADIEIQVDKVLKNEIPFRYSFLNPLMMHVENDQTGLFDGKPIYTLKLSASLKKSLKKDKELLASLPREIQEAIKQDSEYIPLDQSKLKTFFYKKDDWQLWANPMISAIIDDIIMLEKMKLADMSALDGAISNIRLWNFGSLEHKILPNKPMMDKLRNILASNVGGGTMDLIWGPELTFTESNTQIYKFLGMEKYNPVLNSIYAGLGVPPTLTGLAGQSGGFTNNFISLKTLIERLEYGRDMLMRFWNDELHNLQKAMGIKEPAELHFDFMVLSDEAAQKNLWLSLADRDVISIETLRERLGETNDIENARIKRETTDRKKKKMPPKADPFHNGNIESEYAKISLQRGELGIEDLTDITPKNPFALEKMNQQMQEKKQSKDNGRPKFSEDKKPRKQRRVLPKSNPSQREQAAMILWANSAQAKISDILTPALLQHYGKKNLRELSREQAATVEKIKFRTLCSTSPFTEITDEVVCKCLESSKDIDIDIKRSVVELTRDFVIKNNRNPSFDEARSINAIAYVFNFFSEN